jgi:hypothetical protein
MRRFAEHLAALATAGLAPPIDLARPELTWV